VTAPSPLTVRLDGTNVLSGCEDSRRALAIHIVLLMSNPLSPAAMLAISMHAQPGVYAVLLGSGVSTAAGIPTGWGVVKDLVRQVAVAAGPGDEESLGMAEADPEMWWAQHRGGQIGYSSLLETLAPTAPARQGLLAGYFEASERDREEGLKTPSRAHEALARLVKRGLVRVILTTNFDRLTERALEAAGVPPQVIARPEAVAGMAPLAHAPATVVKLHGDYLDLGNRNTPEELEDYPEEWRSLLAQVFDEYGLLVTGWSADWDTGLVAALQGAPNRRYPLYWDSRSGRGETARRLLEVRAGQLIEAASADNLFSGLLASVEALDRLAEPPLTTAMAVARLKRYLPDPVRRIDLHDLVMDKVAMVADTVERQAKAPMALRYELMEPVFEDYLENTRPLLALLAEGVRHDVDGSHDRLWLEVLQALLDLRRGPHPGVTFHEFVVAAQHYPAVLALYAMGLATLRNSRDGLLLRLLREASWERPFHNLGRRPAFEVLDTYGVLDARMVNALPRWNGQQWLYPPSHMLRADLADVLRDQVRPEGYAALFDDLEYRVGLVQYVASERHRPAAGEFVGERRWTHDAGVPAEQRFRDEAAITTESWPWWELLNSPESLEEVLVGYREVLVKYQRWG